MSFLDKRITKLIYSKCNKLLVSNATLEVVDIK